MSRIAGLLGVLAIACAACTGVNAPADSPASSLAIASASASAAASAGLPTLAPVPGGPTPSASPEPTADQSAPAATPTNKPRKSHLPKPTSSATPTPTATATSTATPTPTPTDVPKPDLIIKTFSVPATVTHGVDATGAMYVQNVGPGDVGPFSVDIFGSCAQEALSLAPVDVDGLAAGADKFIHISFSFTSTGACKVGATIDADNQVAESNEDNNEISVDITSQ